jgi:hypothetical protein
MKDDQGNDLGRQCPSATTSTFYLNSGYSYQDADSPVPCQGSPFFPTAFRIYTVIGQHTDTLGDAYGYTKASLAFAPAGRSQDFHVYLDSGTDYRNAMGPVVLIPQSPGGVNWASASDLQVAYTSRNQNDVYIQLNVPYAARKARHDIAFPVGSNTNPWFGVVIYDATPIINTGGVSPSSIPAGVPTALTITGSGFGDHPTVYVNNTPYTTTAITQPSPGQDSVTITVNLPASLAGSSIPIYVVSNGAGGQPFSGAPQGNQYSSNTSNTVQAPVTLAPPTITAMCSPPQNPCPTGATATLQIGSTGIPFEIDGNNFTAYTPTSLTGSCVANVSFTAYGDNSVIGTLNLAANATAGPCTVTFTPAGMSQSATYVVNLVPGPPTISGNQGIWYLGAATANDNCVPGSTNLAQSCYYNATVLTLAPGPGGAPPSNGSPAYWSFTDPATGQNPAFISHTCGDPACSQVTITVTSQPPYCGVVTVAATLAGTASAPYTLYADWPSTASAIGWQDLADNDDPNPGNTGYKSNNTLRLLSACGQAMYGIAVHEQFPAGLTECNASTGWTGLGPLTATVTGTGPFAAGQVIDTVGISAPPQGMPGGISPSAQCPGMVMTGQCIQNPTPNQLSIQANAFGPLFIIVGSQSFSPPGQYFTAAPNMQVRYTDHGRDEVGSWACPIR